MAFPVSLFCLPVCLLCFPVHFDRIHTDLQCCVAMYLYSSCCMTFFTISPSTQHKRLRFNSSCFREIVRICTVSMQRVVFMCYGIPISYYASISSCGKERKAVRVQHCLYTTCLLASFNDRAASKPVLQHNECNIFGRRLRDAQSNHHRKTGHRL